MATSAPSTRLQQLLRELETTFQEEITNAVAAASDQARRNGQLEMAGYLNQCIRRLRQTEDFPQLASTLTDAAAPFCNALVAFGVAQSVVKIESVRGIPAPGRLEFPIADAAALRALVETREPVVALNTPTELSSALMVYLQPPAGEKVCLFPILARGRTAGILYCAGNVEMAPLELLAEVSSAVEDGRVEAAEKKVEPEPPVREPLVTIQQAAAPDPGMPRWDSLTPAEQRLHLRAQRFARVQVAEMRLYRADVVRTGRAQGDLYGALKNEIDRARDFFAKNFVAGSRAMVDYLHLELLRTLANNDASLLGENYPGPLA